jgi:alcohol dehydrogenase (cytochrome c)
MSASLLSRVGLVLLSCVAITGQPAAGQSRGAPDVEWPTYHGDDTGRHHSTLSQVTVSNVKNLTLAWIYRVNLAPAGALMGGSGAEPPAPAGGGFGTTGRAVDVKSIPVMVGGVLFLTTPNHAWAVDARTGEEVWHYIWKGRNAIGNRGVGVYDSRWLYMLTPDNTLVSLEASSGRERWNRPLTAPEAPNFSTMAPLVIGRQVIVGVGGDGGTNTPSWVESRDVETGEQKWKWRTVPGPGEPGIETWPSPEVAAKSAAAPWQTPTYDPELNLLYITTGQPTPTYNGKGREGANLYSSSVVALNADTGRMVWYYQFSPHDTHDWDATQVPVLIDDTLNGQPRKLLAQANRNGYFFVLDRIIGTPVVVKPFALSNSYRPGVDARGQLIPDPAKEGAPAGALVFPDQDGAANYPAPSYSPGTGLFYVNATDAGSIFYLAEDPTDPTGFGRPSEWHIGLFSSSLLAIDYRDGSVKWRHRYPQTAGFWSSTHPGVLTTAGGVLFSGDPVGHFIAFNAATGEILWRSRLGQALTNTPQTYMLDGVQYVTVASGDNLFAFALQ